MTTVLEAVQTFWVITEDLANHADQETAEMNKNYQVHKEYADKWWVNCVVNEFDPDEFYRITKDLMTDGQQDTIGFMVDQVNNMTEDQETEGA